MITFKEYLAEEIDYDTYKVKSKEINDKETKLSDILVSIGGHDPSNEVRNTPKWKKAKSDYAKSFKELQTFNLTNKKNAKKHHQEKRSSWKN